MTYTTERPRRVRLALVALGALLALAWPALAQADSAQGFDCHRGALFALKSQPTGLYVSAELGWEGGGRGILRARARSVGPWERFRCATVDGRTYFYNPKSDSFVTSEIRWHHKNYAILRARAELPDTWEAFTVRTYGQQADAGLEPAPEGSSGFERAPVLVALKSVANSHWVSADYNWTGHRRGILHATAWTPRSWERFYVRWLD